MNRNFKHLALWLVTGLLLVALFTTFSSNSNPNEINYSSFVDMIDKAEVRSVNISGSEIEGRRTDGSEFLVYAPEDPELIQILLRNNVVVSATASDEKGSFLGLVVSALPAILMIAVWIYILRQMQNSNGRAMGFGKSKAKVLNERDAKVTFDDVAGVEEAKQDLEEIVEFLRSPRKFTALGGKIPKGVLLIGPPGTGKTLLARAIAGEANVPFFSISGSDFVEMFVGVGASRVRDMFEQAKKNAPCIIFVDELDAVGRHRGAGLGGGNDEREQTLNQLLVEMDGFEATAGIILIAATNRPDVLDPALLRPGRFDRQITVPNPDILGREQILGVHTRTVPTAPDVDLHTIARGTSGFSGAELMNLVNEAALLAARRNRKIVSMREFEDAKDRVLMGTERRSMIMSDDEKRLTAYHEAGHAIVAINLEDTDPVHKATIIPRGRALGLVMQLPENDKLSMTYNQMVARLAILMAGRVAEERTFGAGNITSGASSDIDQATRLARAMVTQWGFSDRLGPVMYGDGQEEVFLGYSMGQKKSMSEETSKVIDSEMRRYINEGRDEATRILTEKADELECLAQGLLKYETLTGTEIKNLINGTPPDRDGSDKPNKERKKATSVPSSKWQVPKNDLGVDPVPGA